MNIAILASGKGSNAKAIIDKINAGEIPGVSVAGIISDKPGAPVLEIAESRGIAHRYIDPQHKGARFSPESVREYIDAIRELDADLVVLAGFMRILPPEFVDAFPQAIINLHPSLLPAYKGKDAIRRAFEAGEKMCGCSVHYVNNELDGGEIIAQTAIEILPGYDLRSLEEKVHAAEHVLHMLDLCGERCVCLGCDLDGVDSLPDGISGIQDMPRLRETLISSGISAETVDAIFFDNLMDFWERAL